MPIKNKFMAIEKWLPLSLLLLALFAFFYFHLYRYLSFATLHEHRHTLVEWTKSHYWLAVGSYILIYTVAVAISVPGATFFTLAGGFLFGAWPGIAYISFSATLGSIIIFSAIRISLAEWVEKKAGTWLKRLEKGFQENAFNYLLTIRLIPIFPFWLINIAAALLEVRLSTFIITTAVGIIPGEFIYATMGQNLGAIFDKNETPNLDLIFQARFFLPLVALAILVLLPVLYKLSRRR